MKKRLKKKKQKPPPQETCQSAEEFLEDGVNSHFTPMKSQGQNVYTIRKDGAREGVLCKIDNINKWTVGKSEGSPPTIGVYRVRKNGTRIILSKIRTR